MPKASIRSVAYPGEHQAIVTRALWGKVHGILRESPRKRAADTRSSAPALLKGLIFGPTGCAMSPTHTRKGGRLYRYYVSLAVLKQGRDACPIGRLPAAEIEAAVIDQVRGLLRAPEIVVGTWRASKPKVDGLSEEQVRRALQDLDQLWDELFPAEQARISSCWSSAWVSASLDSTCACGSTGSRIWRGISPKARWTQGRRHERAG